MRAMRLLQNLFDNACQSIDKRIRKSLFSAVEALTRCRQLSITSLGRSLNSQAKVKHTIKCVDRLFGNIKLHKNRHVFYAAMVKMLLKNNKQPVVLVDWSGLTPCGTFHFLSASIAVKGRSLTLYDQAYPLKEYGTEKAHRHFLKTLKQLLPCNYKPIIVTDAGFRNSWFKAVLATGWDFIGRVRNSTKYCKADKSAWFPIKSLYLQATKKAYALGRVSLSQSSPLECFFYIKKEASKNRIKKNLAGQKVRCSSSLKHAKGAAEPWLIASSLSTAEITASNVMTLYKKRMQIEESFRDLKNTRNGFGLRHCRSFKVERLNIALLIGALAMLILWLFGIAAKQLNLHYSFQANSEKCRNVLSVFVIGWQSLMRPHAKFNKIQLMNALDYIARSTADGSQAC